MTKVSLPWDTKAPWALQRQQTSEKKMNNRRLIRYFRKFEKYQPNEKEKFTPEQPPQKGQLMGQTIKTDLIPLLKNLTAALRPHADYHSVDLKFRSALPSISISHDPEAILSDLTTIIMRKIQVAILDVEEVHIRVGLAATGQYTSDTLKPSGVSFRRHNEIAPEIYIAIIQLDLRTAGKSRCDFPAVRRSKKNYRPKAGVNAQNLLPSSIITGKLISIGGSDRKIELQDFNDRKALRSEFICSTIVLAGFPGTLTNMRNVSIK